MPATACTSHPFRATACYCLHLSPLSRYCLPLPATACRLGDEFVRRQTALSLPQVQAVYVQFVQASHRHKALEAMAEDAHKPMPGSPWSLGL